ncbi:MAG: O-methyltransferase [Chloroflexota bacterium]|nr:O-methyltransferase [Chloroflexota bacterium]
MTETQWRAVDDYFSDLLVTPDAALAETLERSAAAGLPPISVSPSHGKLLHLLARAIDACAILEIGTLGGYSAIWLARALPAGGRLITLQAEPAHAAVARANIEAAGVGDRVEIRLGNAADLLAAMVAAGEGPFDLVFIDADKPSTAAYFQWALQLARQGSLIVVDNVVRGGAVIDAAADDPGIEGVRRFIELLAAEPRVTATALQTVGGKGYDGFAIALVTTS